MEDVHVTTSTIINFSERLEEGSAKFYEELAERLAEHKDTFLAWAKESRKNKVLVIRTYQETITDALEACFCFEGLNLGDYSFEGALATGASHAEALKKALALEEKAQKFYLDVAERSQALLATIPRAFRRVAETRGKRKAELQAMMGK
jgi:rubrerythrin